MAKQLNLPDSMTLGETRGICRERVKAGESIECPVCKQTIAVYLRKPYKAVIEVLILLYQEWQKYGHGYFNVKELLNERGSSESAKAGGDYAKGVYWKLIEKDPNSSKLYRITQIGREFVEGKRTIPETAKVYNGEVIGYGLDTVGIKDVIEEGFDYEGLFPKGPV